MKTNKRKQVEADNAEVKISKVSKDDTPKTPKTHLQNTDKPKRNFSKKAGPDDAKPKPPFKGKKFAAKGPNKGKDGKDAPPNWSEFKKKKKELRVARKQKKVDGPGPVSDIVAKAKQLSEKLRRKKYAPEEREKLVESLHAMLRGSYVRLALAHDTSRIIQWLLKFSPSTVRIEVTKELISIVSQMAQSKYARNCIKKMLKYGTPEIHSEIIASFYGSVVNLTSHSFSAPILDVAYTQYSNEKQRHHLQQEFYGDIYKKSKDDKVHKLRDTFKDSPEMKNAILSATKANLERILNKNVHDNALMHAVLYNYLSECSKDERNEMIANLCMHVAPLSNSKFGVKVAVMCVQYGTNKDKKTILKVMKEHAVPLSTHEHGHLLLLAIFSSVDDTVLVKKALLSILLEKVNDIVKEEWGRKTLLWLVAPGDKKHFHPSFLTWLQEGVTSGNSKKDPNVRSAELLEATLPVLCKSLQQDPQFWLSNGSIGVLCVAVLKAAKGDDLKNSLSAVCQFLCKTDWVIKEGEEEINGIEHPAIHACLKKLAQDDKYRYENGLTTFGEELCQEIKEETISHWLGYNRGCFLLVCIFENNTDKVQKNIAELISGHEKELKKKAFAGAKILLKKLTTDNQDIPTKNLK